jgi:hypothetical protein
MGFLRANVEHMEPGDQIPVSQVLAVWRHLGDVNGVAVRIGRELSLGRFWY